MSRSVHRVNCLLRPIDTAFFAPVPERTPGPLFLVGAPRSGSTLTFQVLTYSLECTYLPRLLDRTYGMTNLCFRLLRGRLRRPKPVFRSTFGRTPGLLGPSEAFGFWREWFDVSSSDDHGSWRRFEAPRAESLRARVGSLQSHLRAPLVAKCLYLSLAIEALANALPDASFVLVERDPLAIAASLLRARQRVTRNEWWSIRPAGFQDHLGEPLIEQVAWQVSETLRVCSTSLRALPKERWRSLRFEHLCRDPRSCVREVARWLAPRGWKPWPEGGLPASFALPASPPPEIAARIRAARHFRPVEVANS